MRTIDHRELSEMVNNDDAIVVEVLDPKYYDKFHLPGAVNVPLDANFDREIQQAAPDKSHAVIVYCMDDDCDASPNAAERMEDLGYERVYDYAAGKMDWKDKGLPIET